MPSTATSTAKGGQQANTAAVVVAADAFLSSLSAGQRDTVLYDFADPARQAGWSNLPSNVVHPNGIALADLDAAQLRAVMKVLDAALSDQGYRQVQDILAADDYLHTYELAHAPERAPGFGRGTYYISFFGTPSPSTPFALQFGGHHLAHNITYSDGRVSLAPEFIGVEPPMFRSNRNWKQPTGQAGRDPGQRPVTSAAAAGDYRHPRLGGRPRRAGRPRSGKGYVSQYDQTRIGWAGATSLADVTTYIRIDGPAVWIEFDNQAGRVTRNIHYNTGACGRVLRRPVRGGADLVGGASAAARRGACGHSGPGLRPHRTAAGCTPSLTTPGRGLCQCVLCADPCPKMRCLQRQGWVSPFW